MAVASHSAASNIFNSSSISRASFAICSAFSARSFSARSFSARSFIARSASARFWRAASSFALCRRKTSCWAASWASASFDPCSACGSPFGSSSFVSGFLLPPVFLVWVGVSPCQRSKQAWHPNRGARSPKTRGSKDFVAMLPLLAELRPL